jgi:hypothetical protein
VTVSSAPPRQGESNGTFFERRRWVDRADELEERSRRRRSSGRHGGGRWSEWMGRGNSPGRGGPLVGAAELAVQQRRNLSSRRRAAETGCRGRRRRDRAAETVVDEFWRSGGAR